MADTSLEMKIDSSAKLSIRSSSQHLIVLTLLINTVFPFDFQIPKLFPIGMSNVDIGEIFETLFGRSPGRTNKMRAAVLYLLP